MSKIICGDAEQVLRSMEAETVDLVVTSPPYDNMRTYGGYTWNFEEIAKELARVLKVGGVIVWVVADQTVKGSKTLSSFKQACYFKEICGLNVHDIMIWEKTGSGAIGSNLCYASNYEFMCVFSKGKPKTTNLIHDRENKIKTGKVKVNSGIDQSGKSKTRTIQRKEFGKRTNIWRVDPKRNSDHPAPFPLKLVEDHIKTWSNPGDLVLDPFCGSGTTCIAAKNLERAWIGIEINKDYIEIIKAALKDYQK